MATSQTANQNQNKDMSNSYDVFIKDEGRHVGVKFKTPAGKAFALANNIPNGLDSYKATGFCGDAVFDAKTAPEGVYELHCSKANGRRIQQAAKRAALVVETF